jgi:hypothetical protein
LDAFRADAQEAEASLARTRVNQLQDAFAAEVDRLDARAESPEAFVETLAAIEALLEAPARAVSESGGPGDVAQLIGQLDQGDEYGLLGAAETVQLRESFRETVQERRRAVADARADGLADRFERHVEAVVENDRPPAATLDQLRALRGAVRRADVDPEAHGNQGEAFVAALETIAVATGSPLLGENARERTKRAHAETATAAIERVRERYRGAIVDHFRERVRAPLAPAATDDEGPWAGVDDPDEAFDRLAGNVSRLQRIRYYVTRVREGHGGERDDSDGDATASDDDPLEVADPRRIAMAVPTTDGLREADVDALLEAFASVIEDEVAVQESRRRRLIETSLEAAIEAVSDEGLDWDARLDALGRLDTILAEPTRETVPGPGDPFAESDGLPDPERMFAAARVLDGERRSDIREELSTLADRTTERAIETVVDRVDDLIGQFLTTAPPDVDEREVLESAFVRRLPNPGEYRNGELTESIGRPPLERAARYLGRFVDMAAREYTHPTQRDIDRVQVAVVDATEARLDEHEPDGWVGVGSFVGDVFGDDDR